MSASRSIRPEGLVEECIEAVDDCAAALQHYPPGVLALAMRIHLAGLLRALIETGACTSAEAAEFLQALSQDVLQPQID